MPEQAATSRLPGRPRDPAADEAILSATLAILAEDGYAGLTVDHIAERAGVGKATIYRRWDSKEEVLLAAVTQLSAEVPVPDTDDLRSDLTAIAEGLAAIFRTSGTRRLVGTLLAEMTTTPELAAALRSGFLSERRAVARNVLERERRRGGLRDDLDIEQAVDLLAAPFYYRLLVTGDPIGDRFTFGVVEAVMRFVAPGDQTAASATALPNTS